MRSYLMRCRATHVFSRLGTHTKHPLVLPSHDLNFRSCGALNYTAIERLIVQRMFDIEQVFIGYRIGGLLIGVAQLARLESSNLD